MNYSGSEPGLVCGPEQFHCQNTISNTILSINEWNREGESCIDARLRCDGRLVFYCFVGADCLLSIVLSGMIVRMGWISMSAGLIIIIFLYISGRL
jgi:hypothetical protein